MSVDPKRGFSDCHRMVQGTKSVSAQFFKRTWSFTGKLEYESKRKLEEKKVNDNGDPSKGKKERRERSCIIWRGRN